MQITSRLKILDQIYAIYDRFAASLDLACKKYCDPCCTSGVTLTTLEGYKIIDSLTTDTEKDFIHQMQQALEVKRFRPQITTNQLARLCADGNDPSEDNKTETWQNCPLLRDHQCPLYTVRPFGCRCLVSRHHCGEKGFAEIDDFVLSVNTVFLQTIEHVDAEGCSGNLVDVLQTLLSTQNRQAYEKRILHCTSNHLIPNRSLEVLMIPPAHRTKIEPILQQLRQIRA
jgi:hypothetical protein